MPDDPNAAPGSLSRLIPGLKDGDRQAMQALWERTFQPLVRVARARLRADSCRGVEAEDVALEAFLELCQRLAQPDANERFPELTTRAHLWRLLVCFTVRAAFDLNVKQARRGRVMRGESALGEEGFAALAGREPAPEFAAAVAELLEQLQDATLRAVALHKLEGRTVPEIAREMDCSPSTVERKLRAIRAIWKAREGETP